MTREKEIQIAACAYGTKGSSLDFEAGARWSDKHPQFPQISIEDDLPCNHEDYINTSNKDGTFYVIALVNDFIKLSRMEKDDDGTWHWTTDTPTYWMPIPKLPK